MKRSVEISIVVGGVVLIIIIGVIVYFTVFDKSPPVPPPSADLYDCHNHTCVKSPTGKYPNQKACQEECKQPPVQGKYYYCVNKPQINRECMSCKRAGSVWSAPYDTLAVCKAAMSSNKNTGTCILYNAADCS